MAAIVLFAIGTPAVGADAKPNRFRYDPAAQQIAGTPLNDDPNAYDASIAFANGETMIAWLAFEPGVGDRIKMARLVNGRVDPDSLFTSKPGTYARPTLTHSGDRWVMTYEQEIDGSWDVVRWWPSAVPSAGYRIIDVGGGPDTEHSVASDGHGGVWIAWQSGQDGRFVIHAVHDAPTDDAESQVIAAGEYSEWQPSIAVASDGRVAVAWDGYDGDSYNVYLRIRHNDEWQAPITIAATPAFEGRAQVAFDPAGRLWILWEEGATRWGYPYRAHMQYQHAIFTDDYGPVHRFRQLRLAAIGTDGERFEVPELPMPSIDEALQRPPIDGKPQKIGAYYERGELLVDPRGKVWVVYRHNYAPWIGQEYIHHVESGWGVYVRCLGAEGWSSSIRLAPDQRDGLQRLSCAWGSDGLRACWTTGRTDRRPDDKPRGVFVASVPDVGGDAPGQMERAAEQFASSPIVSHANAPAKPDPVHVAGEEYHLYYGDLHRHTDLSLCFVPLDGTMDDAYRYAIDVAKLDFLGITDHTRDIAQGDALSHLWWRCCKEVTRHDLCGHFAPFYSYERSTNNTDHNVISLRPDVLRPYQPPLPDFWKELGDGTITIPHQPFAGSVWDYQDPALRPLLEIYQGCRDWAQERDALAGLSHGYRLGFIASSDHLSTSASYAVIWATRPDRQSLFDAMKARRTYAATSKIMMDVRAGEHWMGECVTGDELPPINIHIVGTDVIDAVGVYVDGTLQKHLPSGSRETRGRYQLPRDKAGMHFVYVYVHQADGNQAWSSPIWLQRRHVQ